MRRLPFYGLLLGMIGSGCAFAGGGLLGLDHAWRYDNSGIWKRSPTSGFKAAAARAFRVVR